MRLLFFILFIFFHPVCAGLKSKKLNQRSQPYRAVRPLGEFETYEPWEIENRENDLSDAKWEFTVGAAEAGGGILLTGTAGGAIPGGAAVVVGTCGMLKAGQKVVDAKKDISKMNRHNAYVQSRERIRHQRDLKF
jgi:hypothetical protein